MVCQSNHTYKGSYDPNKIVVCFECGVDYDAYVEHHGQTTMSHQLEQTLAIPQAKLKPHQRDAVDLMSNGCVLAGGVGTGKTHTAIAYAVEKVMGGDLLRDHPVKVGCDIVVITTAKKRDDFDWQRTASQFGISHDPDLSYSGHSIVVDSWNNIGKYKEVTNTFFIFDEQRVVGSGAWVKSFLKITKNNQWILLSATPADTWSDYIPLFVAHGFYRNRTHFLEEHAVWTFHGKYRKIRGYVGVRHLKQLRDSILVEMPYERHTTRHLQPIEVDHDESLFEKVWKRRWNVFDDVPIIDVAEMHRLGRKVVNSDPSRLTAIEQLGKKHPRLIIFYNFDYELERLRTLASRMDVTVAEWNGHKHEPVPVGEKRWLYLVQYQAGAEGWNCTSTDAIVFYSLTYSHKLFEQSQGRIDRLDSPFSDLWYYILKSNSKIDKIIWRALSLKKSFHEGRNEKFVSQPIPT